LVTIGFEQGTASAPSTGRSAFVSAIAHRDAHARGVPQQLGINAQSVKWGACGGGEGLDAVSAAKALRTKSDAVLT